MTPNEKDIKETKLFVSAEMLGIKTDEKGSKFIITGPEVHTYYEDGSITVDFPIQYL